MTAPLHSHGYTMPSGLRVNFTVSRIPARKPGGAKSPQSGTGQHIPMIDFPGVGFIPDPAFTGTPTGDDSASGHCGGGVTTPAAVLET